MLLQNHAAFACSSLISVGTWTTTPRIRGTEALVQVSNSGWKLEVQRMGRQRAISNEVLASLRQGARGLPQLSRMAFTGCCYLILMRFSCRLCAYVYSMTAMVGSCCSACLAFGATPANDLSWCSHAARHGVARMLIPSSAA